MSLFNKDSGTTVNQAAPSPEQLAQIRAQTNFFTGTVQPAYQQAVLGANQIYNQSAPGYTAAAQNVFNTSGQAQEALGGTGESALRTGMAGLQDVFGQDYEQRQIAAALGPAQAQYQQNITEQNAQFGGAGELGSARQALANANLASSTQQRQSQAAAGVLNDIANRRAQVGQSLAQLGQSGIGQAVGAAQTGMSAAGAPQDLYNKYASVIFGTPSASYNANFAGTGGSTQSKSGMGFNI